MFNGTKQVNQSAIILILCVYKCKTLTIFIHLPLLYVFRPSEGKNKAISQHGSIRFGFYLSPSTQNKKEKQKERLSSDRQSQVL